MWETFFILHKVYSLHYYDNVTAGFRFCEFPPLRVQDIEYIGYAQE